MNSSVMVRIENGKIRAEDIKHKDRLTQEQIRSISPALAYEWIKSEKWTFKDFKKWLGE